MRDLQIVPRLLEKDIDDEETVQLVATAKRGGGEVLPQGLFVTPHARQRFRERIGPEISDVELDALFMSMAKKLPDAGPGDSGSKTRIEFISGCSWHGLTQKRAECSGGRKPYEG